MSLESRISGAFEGLEAREVSGRIELHTPLLEGKYPDEKMPCDFQSFMKYWLRQGVEYLSRKRMTNLIAENLESTLEEKIKASSDQDQKEKLGLVLNAFKEFHNIKIDGITVNYNDSETPNYLLKNVDNLLKWAVYGLKKSRLLLGASILIANKYVPVIDEIPSYIIVPLSLFATFYELKKTHRQSVDFPIPARKELRRDIIRLSRSYDEARKTDLGHETAIHSSGKRIDNFFTAFPTMAISQVRRVIDRLGYTDKVFTDRERNYDLTNVLEMKKKVDELAQKYFPSLDLNSINIGVEELSFGVEGDLRSRNEILISIDALEKHPHSFYRTYAHSLAHLDGIEPEGMAEYNAMQVLREMNKEHPEERLSLEFYDPLLTATIHTYVIMRKHNIRKGMKKLGYLGDLVSFNAKRLVNLIAGKRQPSAVGTGINKRVYDELIRMNAPKEVVDRVFKNHESPALEKQLMFAVQYILKNDEFRAGFTKESYEVAKFKGMI